MDGSDDVTGDGSEHGVLRLMGAQLSTPRRWLASLCNIARLSRGSRALQNRSVALISDPWRSIVARWLITRHPGAHQWIQRQGIEVDAAVERLDLRILSPGDEVIGTLPVHLAAAVCRHGAYYYHVAMDVPQHWRGRELSEDGMIASGARLEHYYVAVVSASLVDGHAGCDHCSGVRDQTVTDQAAEPGGRE